ncbi:uncharacterized protein BO97DRAFT_419922 [Aspergillus homomorphus CBS 101889]|uniref:Uncharacterized protein n=1 Tax=Aspergillus homomorphus (strain CBS 101889) TaxID=1450537 RepID=A0A395ICY4_ASPHC|nr:hypothetical protein BO97DRAFT_419922 [Aspergillus homomorphus CBS 101889]RAL17689.1 hypothetical protein BO97DRAFT_419922 [Aspergillus homomorphus CBS 101889]
MKLHFLSFWVFALLVTLVTSTAISTRCNCDLAKDNTDDDNISYETTLAYFKCLHRCTGHASVKKALNGYLRLYTRDNVDSELDTSSAPVTHIDPIDDSTNEANTEEGLTLIDDYENDEEGPSAETSDDTVPPTPKNKATATNDGEMSTLDRKCHRRCRRHRDCCHTDICYSGVCLGPGKSP